MIHSITQRFQINIKCNHFSIVYLLLLVLVFIIPINSKAESEDTVKVLDLDLQTLSILNTEIKAQIYNIFLKGFMEKSEGDFDAAIKTFQQGIDMDTTEPRFYREIAECAYIMSDLKTAREYALLSSQLDPDSPKVHLLLGTIYARQNNPRTSISELTTSLSLDSSSDDAEALLGEEYMRLGELDNAIQHYENAVRLDPSDVLSHLQLGNLYSQKKEYDQAADHFKTVTRLAPRHVLAYVNLGWSLELSGKEKEAETT